MNREVRLALILVAVILGGSIITFFRHYTALDPVGTFNTALGENPTTSSTLVQQEKLEKQRQPQLFQVLEQKHHQQVQIADDKLIEAIGGQQKLEKYLLCAISIDSGACSCRDKRDDTVVSVSTERCIHYADRQVASNQLTR